MSKKATTAKTLAKKLADKKHISRIVEVADIEDSVKFFSPVQTRQQRKISKRSLSQAEITKGLPGDSVAVKVSGEEKGNNTPLTISKHPNETKIKLAQDTTEQQAPLDSIKESTNGWQPKDWRVVLENISAMRSVADAPVDTMGCHKCSDNEADEKTQRFQKLIALMLSSQTKDEITYEAMQRLKNIQATPKVIVDFERSKLEELLKPVSFYKNKAKYIQLASKILIDKYDSDIPSTIKELEALPGVGPKMAHICMATAWNEITGIGVDVHVHRITNRLKWLPKPTKEPEQTRIALEAWLPRDVWQEVNHLMVGFGQTVCKAVRPQCVDCLNRYICPASEFKGVIKNKSDKLSKDGTVNKKPKLKRI